MAEEEIGPQSCLRKCCQPRRSLWAQRTLRVAARWGQRLGLRTLRLTGAGRELPGRRAWPGARGPGAFQRRADGGSSSSRRGLRPSGSTGHLGRTPQCPLWLSRHITACRIECFLQLFGGLSSPRETEAWTALSCRPSWSRLGVFCGSVADLIDH